MTTTTTSLLADFVGAIAAPDPKWLKQARSHLDNLTKPLGSLGRLEDIAARFVAIRNGEIDGPLKKAAYVFAADHGIAAEGVSAYPKEVTRQMVLNFLQQGAAINVLANLHETELTIVDVGVDADFGDLPGLLHRKVRSGTRNMLHEPAMSEEEMLQALQVGLRLATSAQQKGQTLIAAGEWELAILLRPVRLPQCLPAKLPPRSPVREPAWREARRTTRSALSMPFSESTLQKT